MSLLKIKIYPSSVLRKRCEEIKELNEEIKELARDMLETMYKHQGIGLAGPQVGVTKRIIVIDVGKGPLVLINPRIEEKSKESDYLLEGCLSLPKIYVKVKRAREIVVSGLDEQGQPVKFKARGLTARAIQHEIDHLSGVLIIDKTNFLRKVLLKLKLLLKRKND